MAYDASTIQQNWSVTLPSNLDAVKKIGFLGLITHNYVNTLNGIITITGDALNTIIEGALTLESLAQFNVSVAVVTGAKFINLNGKVALAFNVTTVSDPISETQLAIAIGLIIGGLVAAIIAAMIVADFVSDGIAIPL